MLSICIRNLPVWGVYAQHQLKNSKVEKVPLKHNEHTHKELTRALGMELTRMPSICIRNLCVCSACAKEIEWCFPPNY
jgi:hypothetical protein